ncbi:Nucleolar GTP-binding protein [Prunus dulcis]|uniref:Nucleolar GTP-binding protein n=1 Tax=Prunus dulcis TaxID=3755 RepID=A0A4Y1QZB7_PRUDU|nr:Nucleolar GTP-binding protein [Prunus dulcis]
MTGAIEVRGIHHRASQSFCTANKKDKKVNCARQLPDVGHAQDLARIPKWKLGRPCIASLHMGETPNAQSEIYLIEFSYEKLSTIIDEFPRLDDVHSFYGMEVNNTKVPICLSKPTSSYSTLSRGSNKTLLRKKRENGSENESRDDIEREK